MAVHPPVKLNTLSIGPWEFCLRSALNQLSSREDQVAILIEGIQISSRTEGESLDMLNLLSGLFHGLDSELRTCLREQVYLKLGLGVQLVTGSQGLNKEVTVVKTRVAVLELILKGWGWFYSRDHEKYCLNEDATVCFEFVCNAYEEFPEMESKKLRTGIEKSFREQLNPAGFARVSFWNDEKLMPWILQQGIPEGIVHEFLHGRINIIGDSKALEELRAAHPD